MNSKEKNECLLGKEHADLVAELRQRVWKALQQDVGELKIECQLYFAAVKLEPKAASASASQDTPAQCSSVQKLLAEQRDQPREPGEKP